jgi:hypothetical protein
VRHGAEPQRWEQEQHEQVEGEAVNNARPLGGQVILGSRLFGLEGLVGA